MDPLPGESGPTVGPASTCPVELLMRCKFTNRLACVGAALALGCCALATPALAGPRFTASSSHATSKDDYGPAQAFDGLLDTSWAEGKPTVGLGEWLEVDLGADVEVEFLSIWGGSFSDEESWRARSRLAVATVTATGPDGEITRTADIGDRFARKDVRIGAAIRSLRITIDEVHEGGVFSETHIAEVAFNFREGPNKELEETIQKNLARYRSTRDSDKKAEEALEKAYAAAREGEEYRENFRLISRTAARGHDYRGTAVQKYVPVGFRLQHLSFHEGAVDMLGRLKDANAINALQRAAAGAFSVDDREWLHGAVAYFRAYQSLLRTPRSTVPNWGSEGMERGAFQSRGEPLAMATDSLGNVYVADVGNNRVQRLSEAGTADRVLGGEKKAIVETWFGDSTEPYASGAAAGTKPGLFNQPVHLTVGNYDILAVIDADMRMQTFDGEGKPLAQWQVDTKWRPRAGRGVSTPILTWMEDDFYLLVEDEVIIYSSKGEQKKRYHLEGGKVQCAVIAAGGKLLVRHVGEGEIIEYKPEDGFRQGRWTKKGLPDDGSEDWDMATDEDDNVYVITDAGMLYKWNKRGKFREQREFFENARDVPRISVFSPIVYVSAKNEITRYVQEE